MTTAFSEPPGLLSPRESARRRARPACYVRHHVNLAGRSDQLLNDDAVAAIHQTSCGLPCAVNNLAVQSLVAAFVEGKGIVDESSAKIAVTEVTAE